MVLSVITVAYNNAPSKLIANRQNKLLKQFRDVSIKFSDAPRCDLFPYSRFGASSRKHDEARRYNNIPRNTAALINNGIYMKISWDYWK